MTATKPTKPQLPAIFTATRRHYYARACVIQATSGTRAAAEFLLHFGFRIETALALLATPNHAHGRHRSQL